MMLLKALEKVQLPLSFKTTIGYGTGHERVYNISPSQLGYLYAYTPAVNEKGKVTFGEVFLVLKGNQKRLVVKNLHYMFLSLDQQKKNHQGLIQRKKKIKIKTF